MYERCVRVEVPFLDKPDEETWNVPDKLNNDLDYFDDLYKKTEYSNLKTAHKKLREWQANDEDKFIKADIKRAKKRQDIIDSKEVFVTKLVDEDIYSKYELDIVKIFNNDWLKYNEFIEKSNAFHDKYIHISHTSDIVKESSVSLFNLPILNIFNVATDAIDYGSMGSQKQGDRLHRTFFTPKYEDMRELTNETNKMKDVVNNMNVEQQNAYLTALGMNRINKNFANLTAIEFKDY